MVKYIFQKINNLSNNYIVMERNIFIYWIGKEYKLIKIFRNLIYLHSMSGKGYKVHFITPTNVTNYIEDLPNYFYKLQPAHQADFIRVHVICKYGGIWLDSDTLVIDSLDYLFEHLERFDGFFIEETPNILCNGIFASRANTILMNKWKNIMMEKLNKNYKIKWSDIGSIIINGLRRDEPELYNNYHIFKYVCDLYPIFCKFCVTEFITKPYDNYKTLVKPNQCLIILTNIVYKKVETMDDFLNANTPLNYFINKSFENLKLMDLDFIEIGTSNFDTLIQNASDTTTGISIDAVKYYIDCLPDKPNVKKLNIGISNTDGSMDVYYVPEKIIIERKLPDWLKGCNSINNYHPAHIKKKVCNFCQIDKVNVITLFRLYYENQIRNVKFLKIDTEGHDCIILNAFFEHIKYLPDTFYPNKIFFQTNELIKKTDVEHTINLYLSIGYKLESRDSNTVLVHEKN